MINYTVTNFLCNGDFSIDIYTNHVFKANNNEDAMRIASEFVSNLERYIKVFFNKNEQDIKVEIIENEYFDKVYLENFIYYDENKGDYLKEVINGHTVYPVCNPVCDIEVNKDEFIELLLRDYSKYFEDKTILKFESTAYGVNKVNIENLKGDSKLNCNKNMMVIGTLGTGTSFL